MRAPTSECVRKAAYGTSHTNIASFGEGAHRLARLVHHTALPLLGLDAIELPSGSTAFATLAHVQHAALLNRRRRTKALHSQRRTEVLHLVHHRRLVTSILPNLHASKRVLTRSGTTCGVGPRSTGSVTPPPSKGPCSGPHEGALHDHARCQTFSLVLPPAVSNRQRSGQQEVTVTSGRHLTNVFTAPPLISAIATNASAHVQHPLLTVRVRVPQTLALVRQPLLHLGTCDHCVVVDLRVEAKPFSAQLSPVKARPGVVAALAYLHAVTLLQARIQLLQQSLAALGHRILRSACWVWSCIPTVFKGNYPRTPAVLSLPKPNTKLVKECCRECREPSASLLHVVSMSSVDTRCRSGQNERPCFAFRLVRWKRRVRYRSGGDYRRVRQAARGGAAAPHFARTECHIDSRRLWQRRLGFLNTRKRWPVNRLPLLQRSRGCHHPAQHPAQRSTRAPPAYPPLADPTLMNACGTPPGRYQYR